MKLLSNLLLFLLLSNIVFANDNKVIKLHNKSIDQLVKEESTKNDNLLLSIVDEDQNQISDNIVEDTDNDLNNTNQNGDLLEDSVFLLDLWQNTSSEDLAYLLKNINSVNSDILKNELILLLKSSSNPPKGFSEEDFKMLIVNTLLILNERQAAYEIISNSFDINNSDNKIFYLEYKLNFLLSANKLIDACDLKKEIQDLNLNNNFFLKVDIFCLLLNEKFDEANLLISLLDESEINQDLYFKYLFNKLQNFNTDIILDKLEINKSNIFLYSAMHRMGNIPLVEDFLVSDPLNLSMPIVLSNSSNIELRIKAAHFAYFNKQLGIDGLSALYQAVDFSFEELNDPSVIIPMFKNNIEKGMAYFYQMIKIQLLPISRLEAIVQFWDFAQINNLELIAYKLSLESLKTVEPSNELSSFGHKIARAYVHNNDFESANKWLLFSESIISEDQDLADLNSTKLLLSLSTIKKDENFTDILFNNLQYMSGDLVDNNNPDHNAKNEILFLIFSTLDENNTNPFFLNKALEDPRYMPSIYLIDKINDSIIKKNEAELLISIISSLNNKNWNEIHPEHFRLVLLSLLEYKDGILLNSFLLEVLKFTKVI